MTQDQQDDRKKDQPDGKKARRTWTKPSLTAYGPIGKLTQGATGAKADGTSSRKATCL